MKYPNYCLQILSKKNNKFIENNLNRRYDFFELYFIYNLISALKGTNNVLSDINKQNKLLSLYNGGLLCHYIKKMPREDFKDDEKKLEAWAFSVNNKVSPLNSRILSKSLDIMNKDLNNIVKPFIETIKEGEKEKIMQEEEISLQIVGYCREYGQISDFI